VSEQPSGPHLDPKEHGPPRRLNAHGLRLEVPEGWSARIFRYRAKPPEVHGPTIHAGNFAIPLDDADYGSTLTDHVTAGRVAFVYTELIPDRAVEPGRGRHAPTTLPGRFRLDEFSPQTMHITRPGQMGLQRFFSVGRRPASVYVVLGEGSGVSRALSELNGFMASLEFARDPEASDYRKPPLERV